MFMNVLCLLLFFWSTGSLHNIYLANSDFSSSGSPVIIIDSYEDENSETEKFFETTRDLWCSGRGGKKLKPIENS